MPEKLFTLEDVEHIIEHVLGIDLPDALAMVQANHTGQEEMRAGRMHGVNVPKSEPCFECKRMMPILLHIGKEE
jgi:hypothetical protein|tara:strand:- start:26 stop:247 length:222 start_codon:yes stop_codon:yes gene_type:complete